MLKAQRKTEFFWVSNNCLGACDGTGIIYHYVRCCSSSYAAWRNQCGCGGEEYADDEELCSCTRRARPLPYAVKAKALRKLALRREE